MLEEATENADRKIAELQDEKARIEKAKLFYASKAAASESRTGIYVRTLPERVILLSDTLHAPTVENLTDYHRHFFAQTDGKTAANSPSRTPPECTKRAVEAACSRGARSTPTRRG